MTFTGWITLYIALTFVATALLALAVYNTHRRGIQRGTRSEHKQGNLVARQNKHLSEN